MPYRVDMPGSRAGLDARRGQAVGPTQLRLLVKVARMYHEGGIRQPQIAEQLHISQPRVSRLLKQAVELGIVRVTVASPPGVHAELEERVERAYGVRDVVVANTADLADDEEALLSAIGTAAAVYLEATLTGGDSIGISSWSSTLLSTVNAMRPRLTKVADRVVQVIGGVGDSTAQVHATRLADRLAGLTGAEAIYLPAPGLAGSVAARDALVADPNIARVFNCYSELTMVLAGLGSLEPSALLRQSGNAIADVDQSQLRSRGAVGDICLRFFDASGTPVHTELDDRVLGIDTETLRAVPRLVAVAGGRRKYTAIRAALVGGWVNILITDHKTAERLAEDAPAAAS